MRTAAVILLIVLFVLSGRGFGTAEVLAQEQKIGYIDSGMIMNQIPEYEEIEERLSLLSESWQNEIEGMNVIIEELQSEYDAREPLYTEEVRQQELAEIENRIRERDQFIDEKYGPDGEYFEYQRELLEPVQRRIYNALQVIAAREEFDFIFDRAEGVRFLYADSRWNLNEAVILELGISQNE